MSKAGHKLSDRTVFHLKNASLQNQTISWECTCLIEFSGRNLPVSSQVLLSTLSVGRIESLANLAPVWILKIFLAGSLEVKEALIELEEPELLGSQLCSSRPEKKLMANLSWMDKPTS